MLIEIVPPTASPMSGYAAAVLQGLDSSLAPMGEVLSEFVSQRFETQTDPSGRPWAPLAEKTLLARARRGFRGTKILIVSAMLRNSFAPRIQPDARRVSIGPGGPAAPYAATHQYGRGRIPARPMLPIGPGGPPPPELVAELRATVADALRSALARYRASRGSR
jgi:phage virion morphogenesis protein